MANKLSIQDVIKRGASHRAQRISFDELRQLKVACWDIESSNLNADFGIMLCAGVKPWGKKPIIFSISDYDGKLWEDGELARDLRDCLNEFDVLVAHYGDRFDVPFLNTRLIAAGHELLRTDDKCFVDTWRMARKRLKLHSNRLDSLIHYLDTKTAKTPLDGHLWTRALAGDETSLAEVVKHNIHDVKALEEVTREMAKFMDVWYSYLK